MNEKTVRNLASGFVINSAVFATLKPAEQQTIFTDASASGKPVTFVANFIELADKRLLRDLALAGEDITLRLEFNKIELTSDELAALRAVKPVLDKLANMKNNYPWLSAEEPVKFSFQANTMRRNNYVCGVKTARLIWDMASGYWATNTGPHSLEVRASGYYKTANIDQHNVTIGCQTISRQEVEAVARHYGWEPNV